MSRNGIETESKSVLPSAKLGRVRNVPRATLTGSPEVVYVKDGREASTIVNERLKLLTARTGQRLRVKVVRGRMPAFATGSTAGGGDPDDFYKFEDAIVTALIWFVVGVLGLWLIAMAFTMGPITPFAGAILL